MRVCAPPLLAPKFSPDGPSATVPVLGCSFPEESYPSLANQPSSGAKQGDVQCEWEAVVPHCCSVSSAACTPMASMPRTCPGFPHACWWGPGSCHVLRTQVSFPRRTHITELGRQARQMDGTVPASRALSVGCHVQATAFSKWISKRLLLTQRSHHERGQSSLLKSQLGTAF